MSGFLIICHTKYDRITIMECIKRALVLVAVLEMLWSSCKCDDANKKKIRLSYLCCKNHNLTCKDRKTDVTELMKCLHIELEMGKYSGNSQFCKEFQTFCGPAASMQPEPRREVTTVHSISETDCAEQGPPMLNTDHDPTCGVSVPVVVIIAILMILLGIVGMLIFTCLTYEIWRSWKICGPFHSCLSHDTYVDPVLKKSHTAGKAAHTNITVNNSTYQDSGMANHSVEPCIYDSPRDSIQADTIYNPASSVGTQENTNIVLEKHEGIKDSIHIHPSQYEILNESGNEDEREHRYSSIHSEPRDSSELTSESGSASRPNTEYQKVERNHVYFQVEKHSKVTTSGS